MNMIILTIFHFLFLTHALQGLETDELSFIEKNDEYVSVIEDSIDEDGLVDDFSGTGYEEENKDMNAERDLSAGYKYDDEVEDGTQTIDRDLPNKLKVDVVLVYDNYLKEFVDSPESWLDEFMIELQTIFSHKSLGTNIELKVLRKEHINETYEALQTEIFLIKHYDEKHGLALNDAQLWLAFSKDNIGTKNTVVCTKKAICGSGATSGCIVGFVHSVSDATRVAARIIGNRVFKMNFEYTKRACKKGVMGKGKKNMARGVWNKCNRNDLGEFYNSIIDQDGSSCISSVEA